MLKRTAALLSIGLALLALCSSEALGGVRSDPARQAGSILPAAVLDPAFGESGLVVLPGETLGSAALGAATQEGAVIVSGGPDLRLLTSSGDPAESFGVAGTLSPPPPGGGEFSLSDFALDAAGRLLLVGTSRFPRDEDEVPHGPNGAPLPIVPSAVRVLRFLPDGRLDPAFGQGGVIETDFGLPPPRDKHGRPLQPSASMEATGIAVDPQGRIVVTGGADFRLGQSCVHDIFEPVAVSSAFVARLTESGALDPSFGPRAGLVGGRKLGDNPLHAESVGEPVIGPNGEITYRSTAISACPRDHSHWGMAQLTPKGSTRKTLGREGAVGGYFTALAGEPDGSVVALAKLPQTGREAFRGRLVRIGPSGKDRSFGHNGSTVAKLGNAWGNEPNSLAVDAQGRILLGGTLATRKRRSILLVRLSADGRQEMSFGPNGRVATSFSGLVPFGPSNLFFDPEGRAVTVHRYKAAEGSGLVLARYLLRN